MGRVRRPESPQLQVPTPLPNAPLPEFAIAIPPARVLAAVDELR